jgi:putative endonuclease
MSTFRQYLDRRSKAIGRRGEALAAAHLERLGYRVLARNHRTRFGELDLVLTTEDERTIVFVEVKTRRLGSGAPWDSLHDGKRGRVRAMRFDAVGVTLDDRGELVRLDHLEGAF